MGTNGAQSPGLGRERSRFGYPCHGTPTLPSSTDCIEPREIGILGINWPLADNCMTIVVSCNHHLAHRGDWVDSNQCIAPSAHLRDAPWRRVGFAGPDFARTMDRRWGACTCAPGSAHRIPFTGPIFLSSSSWLLLDSGLFMFSQAKPPCSSGPVYHNHRPLSLLHWRQ
jgi:hypothetical protein